MKTVQDYPIFSDEIFDKNSIRSGNSIYMIFPMLDEHFTYTIVREYATMDTLPLYWIDMRSGLDIKQSTALIPSDAVRDFLVNIITGGFGWLQI